MALVLTISLLITIYSGLVTILYFYGKLKNRATKRTPAENRTLLQEWLTCHELQLPSVDMILSELNHQAKEITPFEGGEQWTELKLERLLPDTSLPDFQIVTINDINDDKLSCSLLVQWPDCSPGIEVSVKVNNEKVTCHLQVDWMIMKVDASFVTDADRGVVINWDQTTPPSSALSCLVVSPDHWKANVDIMDPLTENEETQASENLASSVTEGVLSLLRNLHLSEFTVQQEIVLEDVLSGGNDDIGEEKGEESEPLLGLPIIRSNHTEREVNEQVVPLIIEPVESINRPISNDESLITPPSNDEIAVTTPPTDDQIPLTTPSTDGQTPITTPSTNGETPLTTPSTNGEIPITTPPANGQISMTTHPSNGQISMTTPSLNGGIYSRQWSTELPVINEPEEEKEEDTPPKLKEKSPPTWRRSESYEQLESITPVISTPSHPNLPSYQSYLRGLAHSEDDLLKLDNNNIDDKMKRRSMTLSVRSYDTDSPMTTSSGQLASTLIYEIMEGTHKRHIVAMNTVHATKLRKQLTNYTKLHVYNDHTFTATHIKGKHLCSVCHDKVTGLFGKQCYICRDCALIVHKQCHNKTNTLCQKSKVTQMYLIYPDSVSSISQL